MVVCIGRRGWVWWAAFALACGEDSASELLVDSGRAANSSVTATGTDAGLHQAARIDAGSCNDQSNRSSEALQAALSGADQSCTADSDCKSASLSTDCFHGCGAVVSAAAQQALDTARTEQNQSTCAGFEARGCVAQVPPCIAPGLPACIGGECAEFESYAPSQADAGTPKSPLALKVAASGMSVELAVDQRLEVTLGTIGRATYGNPELSSTALRFAQRFFPRFQNPGGPTTVFVFQAVSAGTVALTIPHPSYEPFKLTVTVR